MMALIYVNTWSKLSHFQVESRDETNLLFRYNGTVIVSCLKNKMKILSMKMFYFKLLFISQFLKESFVVQAWYSSSPI